MTEMKPAPSFARGRGRTGSAPYPLGGIKSGPAWRAMWGALVNSGDEFLSDEDLRDIGAKAGRCAEVTAKTILIRAANAGFLERKHDRSAPDGRPTRTRVAYRIAEQYR